MKRRKIEHFLICTIIICGLLIFSILAYVFLHETTNLPKEVFVLPYKDEKEIIIEVI